jgi:hypothetical protein
LPARQVVTHYFTGIDNPLVYTDCDTAATHGLTDCVGELRERLGDDRVDTFAPGVDEYGIPLSIDQRRSDLLAASARLFLNATDDEAQLGKPFHVRVTAIALSGHNFPSGFSQERTAWIELDVTAKLSAASAHICNDQEFVRLAEEKESQFCRNGAFILYQSGYLIDKPHPETGEMTPDGNLHDEDLEHLSAVVNPFNHHNEVFEEGVDNGPVARIFEGEPVGLVLFRNELLRLYGPACIAAEGAPGEGDCPAGTRATGIPASNRNHPRTGEALTHILEEETFSAGAANTVDNWRSLPPLDPKTFVYEIELPSQQELAELGIEVEGPLRVQAKLHFLHFPPLFLRFLARVSGGVPYALPPAAGATTMPYSRVSNFELQQVAGYSNAAGLRGPADHDFQLFDEKRIDDLLRTVRNISTAQRLVPLRP